MKLIDILVQELPKRGGWPDGADFVAQDGRDGRIKFGRNPIDVCLASKWNNEVWQGDWNFSARNDFICHEISSDWHAIFTREQYEAALAASKPEWDGEGLPGVGIKCEHCPGGTTQHEWEIVTVAGIYENLVTGFTDFWLVKENGFSYTVGNPYRFRPIRSEADKKRDTARKDIAGILFNDANLSTASALDIAGLLVEAIAASKISGVKLED